MTVNRSVHHICFVFSYIFIWFRTFCSFRCLVEEPPCCSTAAIIIIIGKITVRVANVYKDGYILYPADHRLRRAVRFFLRLIYFMYTIITHTYVTAFTGITSRHSGNRFSKTFADSHCFAVFSYTQHPVNIILRRYMVSVRDRLPFCLPDGGPCALPTTPRPCR